MNKSPKGGDYKAVMISENRNWKQNPEELERSWETIGISNDFLFGKLMREHPGLCQKLLQRILPELQIDSFRDRMSIAFGAGDNVAMDMR